MEFSKILSKESIIEGLKSAGKLRIKISHDSILTFSALLLILFVAFVIRVLPLRWEIETGAMHLSEFDPYYQYSLVRYMVTNGYISPFWPNQWVDTQRWYPGGINMAMSYPGLPLTAAVLYNLVSALGVNIDLMSFCALFPALMGTLACLIIYFVGKDLGGKTVGMFASLFLALSSSFIQRTSLGFFDDETVGIVALLLFAFMFLRAIDTGRTTGSTIKYSLGAAAALSYFIASWGAAYYPIGLTVLFVFVLLLLRRYSRQLLLSYSVTFGLGLFIAINIPYITTKYLTSFAILPVAGVFILLLLNEAIRASMSSRSKILIAILLLGVLIGGFTVLWQLGYMREIAGKFVSVINPSVRESSPLVESVAEHRISSWGSVYYDLGIGIVFFITGLFFVIRSPSNRNLFLLLFGLTSLYFASSMVRLLVLMAPAFSLLAGVGIVGLLKPFYTLLREQPKIVTKRKFSLERVGKEFSGTAVFLIFIILMTNLAFSPQTGGLPKVIRQAYAPVTITAGSLPIAPNEPVTEWFELLDWTKSNLGADTVVCSWWDYGYWLTFLGNVTSLADNATINGTQIENVGFTFMANETQSLKMLAHYNAKYVLVFTSVGLASLESGDSVATWVGYGDEGKWMWMAKISGKAEQRFITDGFLDQESSWTDETKFGKYDNSTNQWAWNDVGKNTTVYKLMSWGKQRWCDEHSVTIDEAGVQPIYFKEAYFAGLTLEPSETSKYGGIVPLVCLYEIDWAKYYSGS